MTFSASDLPQDSLPIEIEFRGVQGVLISYDQLDSAVITAEYLDECKEYRDSLESTMVIMIDAAEIGEAIQNEQEARIATKDSLSDVKDNFIEYQRKGNKKLKRQNKVLKFITPFAVGAAIIEAIVIWLRD